MTEEDLSEKRMTDPSSQMLLESAHAERFMSASSTDEVIQPLIIKVGRSESFCALSQGMVSLGRRVNRSDSVYVPPYISEGLIQKVTKKAAKGKYDESVYLKERGALRHLIQIGQIEKAREFINGDLSDFIKHSTKTRAICDAL
jgi:hypothetical protein